MLPPPPDPAIADWPGKRLGHLSADKPTPASIPVPPGQRHRGSLLERSTCSGADSTDPKGPRGRHDQKPQFCSQRSAERRARRSQRVCGPPTLRVYSTTHTVKESVARTGATTLASNKRCRPGLRSAGSSPTEEDCNPLLAPVARSLLPGHSGFQCEHGALCKPAAAVFLRFRTGKCSHRARSASPVLNRPRISQLVYATLWPVISIDETSSCLTPAPHPHSHRHGQEPCCSYQRPPCHCTVQACRKGKDGWTDVGQSTYYNHREQQRLADGTAALAAADACSASGAGPLPPRAGSTLARTRSSVGNSQ